MDTIKKRLLLKEIIKKSPQNRVELLRCTQGYSIPKRSSDKYKELVESGILAEVDGVYRITDADHLEMVSSVIEPEEIRSWRRVSNAVKQLTKSPLFEEEAVSFFSKETGIPEDKSREFLKYEGMYESWKDNPLCPEAPGLDEETRVRRRVLRTMSTRWK